MIRNNVVPQQSNVTISLPANYVGKAVEILAYTVDEIEGSKQVKENKFLFQQSSGLVDEQHLMLKEPESELNNIVEREFGCAKNAFVMKEDFDDDLEDFKEYV
jgi:hypothetical protein